MENVKSEDTRNYKLGTNVKPTKTEIDDKDEVSTSEEAVGIACSLTSADEYETSEADGSVKIRFSAEKGHASAIPAISVMEFMDRATKRWPNRPALNVERQGQWITWTYAEYLQDVKTAAKAFIKVCSYLTQLLLIYFFIFIFYFCLLACVVAV